MINPHTPGIDYHPLSLEEVDLIVRAAKRARNQAVADFFKRTALRVADLFSHHPTGNAAR